MTAIDPVNALAATLGAGPDGRIHLLYWDWVEQGAAEWGGHYRLSHAWQAIPGGGQ